MIGKPGPFEILGCCDGFSEETKPEPPRRRYECSSYKTCLELAAALDWENFTCRGCCGAVNESLLWRAHQARKKDQIASSICDSLPEIGCHETVGALTLVAKIAK